MLFRSVRALIALYPWHPYLKNILRESSEAAENLIRSKDSRYEDNNNNSSYNNNNNNRSMGFLLFECQIISLLQHTHGSTPLFLRLFLRCAHNAVNKGFSIWFIWSDWLRATCVSDLLTRILDSFERGYHPTVEMIQDDNVRSF